MSVFQLHHPDIPTKALAILKDCDEIVNHEHIPCYPIQIFGVCLNNKSYALPRQLVKIHSEKLHALLTTGCGITGDEECFDLLVSYMYDGLLEIPRNQLVEFNDSVAKMGFDRLVEEIAEKIVFESNDELLIVFEKAIDSDNTTMIETCVKVFVKEFQSIPLDQMTKLVPKFLLSNMDRILGSAEIHNGPELKVFHLLNKWIQTRTGAIDLSRLKKHIRFESIESADLIFIVKPSGVLTDAEYMEIIEKKLIRSDTELKIYVCHVANPIPQGYRIVTDEEFATDKFQQELKWNYFFGFEIIGESAPEPKITIGYLVTSSRKTVKINYMTEGKKWARVDFLRKINSINYAIQPDSEIQFCSVKGSDCRNDGYMCVKI